MSNHHDVQPCVPNADSICETEYVGEILELCKDCDIPTPDEVPPSDIQVWFTKWGIALFYAAHDAKEWVSRKIFGDRSKRLSSQSVE